MTWGQRIRGLVARIKRPVRFFVTTLAGRNLLRQKQPAPRPAPTPASLMLRGLAGGFTKAAAANLESFKVSHDLDEVADAAWGLAQWNFVTGDYSRALDNLTMRRLAQPRAGRRPAHRALEVEALIALGRMGDAERIIQDAIAAMGAIPQLCFSAANAAALKSGLSERERDRLRIDWLSKPFVQADFAALELKNTMRPLAFDNVKAKTDPHPRSGEAKVSILMPAYNAAATLPVAIESLLNQCWTNLELIVVDDGSKDNTWRIMQSFAAQDQRVIALRHEQNRGAYAARNTALKIASGDFVTVNDADDWSHPQRLALQVLELLDAGHKLNTTRCVRVNPNLTVRVAADGGMFIQNYSSLITSRQAVASLGGWDELKFGADEELYRRLMLTLGAEPNILHRNVPLSFASTRSQSLTMQRDTGGATAEYGARREIKEAFAYWHKIEMAKQRPDLAMQPGKRRFPVPRICSSGPGGSLNYDILFVSDLSMPGGVSAEVANMIRAANSQGLRCACFHWPRFDHVGNDVDLKIRHLLHAGAAQSVVSGESVACQLVIVSHPPILNQLPDRVVEVAADSCVIVLDQPPNNCKQGGTADFAIERIARNARTAFRVAPTLAPNSPVMRRILQSRSDPDLSQIDWTPLVDMSEFRRKAPSWDNARPPVLGRHCRDAEEKWLSGTQALRQDYCTGTSLEVSILGGAEFAKRTLKEIPDNWRVLPFDALPPSEFLAEIDFFVHYPSERSATSFERAPVEAMAVGVPVILPHRLEDIFGAAAIYADPPSVLSVIEALWADRRAYETQVARGLAFVTANCSPKLFHERVRAYLSPVAADVGPTERMASNAKP